MAPKVETVSLSEFAKDWGVTIRSVQLWLKDGMPSRLVNGSRCVVRADANRWVREREAERVKAEKPQKASSLEEVELRHETAKATKAELELRRMEGELISVDEAVAAMEARIAPLRAELLTLPQRWAPALVGCKSMPEMTAKLDAAVVSAMRTLSGSEE